jgi:hypothetical protein
LRIFATTRIRVCRSIVGRTTKIEIFLTLTPLPARIRQQFARKAEKLAKYHGRDTTTVLLIENDDMALMNHVKMLNAIRKACPSGPPPGVDQIWYADTSFAPDIAFMDFTPSRMR